MRSAGTASPAGVLDQLHRARVVPVVTIREAADSVPLVEALVAGGLPVIEITLRTAAGLDSIRQAVGVPGAVVGAGTVTTGKQAEAALDAGARFVVSPGMVDDVVEACRARGVLALPGIATPTEMIRAVALGCPAVKLFPAALLGGPSMIRALAALVPDLGFVPTGGIDLESAPGYLAIPQVLAVGGSWMVPGSVLAAHDWPAVVELAGECAALREPA